MIISTIPDATTGNQSLLIGFPEYDDPARDLAAAACLPYAEAEIHHFPDGESRIRLPEELPSKVVFCRSLYRPNEKLVELMLAAATARRLGAKHLTLIAPYLCYMRQDKAFRPGESISQTIVGGWLGNAFDALLTVDPHLHRIHRLHDAVPLDNAIALGAAEPMADFLAEKLDDPLLIGPDAESEQWVAAIAKLGSLQHAVALKQRFGDRDVRITLPAGNYNDRQIVLIDDVVSTGCTLEATAKALEPLHPAGISVLVTHALFTGNAQERLHRAGIDQLWSCDSIPHPTNRIKLAPLLAAALHTKA